MIRLEDLETVDSDCGVPNQPSPNVELCRYLPRCDPGDRANAAEQVVAETRERQDLCTAQGSRRDRLCAIDPITRGDVDLRENRLSDSQGERQQTLLTFLDDELLGHRLKTHELRRNLIGTRRQPQLKRSFGVGDGLGSGPRFHRDLDSGERSPGLGVYAARHELGHLDVLGRQGRGDETGGTDQKGNRESARLLHD